jgi:hypothetical protein
VKHHFARAHALDVECENCVAAGFGTKNCGQVAKWRERGDCAAFTAINRDGNHARDSGAARIILPATFSGGCANCYVFLFCHDCSSLQTFSDRNHFRFPISDCRFEKAQRLSPKSIGNWQLAIGNVAGR